MIAAARAMWHGAPMRRIAALLTGLLMAMPCLADAPSIIAAEARPGRMGWTIRVTLRHHDSGWDHFASGWSISLPDGETIATDDIPGPHVGQMEFAVVMKGVDVPAGTAYVLVRARCNLVGWSAEATRVDLRP
ncbi:MAG: hypothetical protein N2422_08995 [Rhodobacteraceae bacterium]|nr:hypothetical protein [Paracoccaceae bacterium]